MLFALSVGSLTRAPADAVAGGVWKGTAEGILVGDGELHSGELDSSSVTDYQVELSFSFSLNGQSELVGGGSGYYTDAHWHLYGVNGKEGAFDSARRCRLTVQGPRQRRRQPRQGAAQAVDPRCHRDQRKLRLRRELRRLRNHDPRDERIVRQLVIGSGLSLSKSGPTSPSITKTVESGDSEDSHIYTHIWSFSITPPAGSSSGGSGSEGGSGAGSGGSCSLSLSSVVAAPSPGHAGKPIAVSFRVSAPAKASLLVAPARGTPSTVVTRSVPKGTGELIWVAGSARCRPRRGSTS